MAWCDQVTVAPEANKIAVFNKGIWKGLKGRIPVGGQQFPISIVGDNLLWKKAQKKEKKNRTSDTINNLYYNIVYDNMINNISIRYIILR